MTPPQRFLCRRLRDKGFEEGVKKGLNLRQEALAKGFQFSNVTDPAFVPRSLGVYWSLG